MLKVGMKLRALQLLIVILGVTAWQAQASDRKFGVGIGLGSVDGISGYYRYDSDAFVQGMISIQGGSSLYFGADACNGYPNLIAGAPSLVPYYCIGAFFANVEKRNYYDFNNDELYNEPKKQGDMTIVGARVPLGLQLFIPQMPIQIAIELAPGMTLVPGTYVFLQTNLLFRLLF